MCHSEVFTAEEVKIIQQAFDILGTRIHDINEDKGFWKIRRKIIEEFGEEGETVVKLSVHQLINTEVSEMSEGVRKDSYDDHLPQERSEDVEAADTFIRLLDYCYGFDIDVVTMIIKKIDYNVERPYMHGKKG